MRTSFPSTVAMRMALENEATFSLLSDLMSLSSTMSFVSTPSRYE